MHEIETESSLDGATNTFTLWRQIQTLLVEALESGVDSVGARDRFSESPTDLRVNLLQTQLVL